MNWKIFSLQRIIDRLFDEAGLSPWCLEDKRRKTPP